MTIALFVIFGLLIFTMFRKQRKVQAQMREKAEQMKEKLAPGTEVMTQFGLYGSVVSVDRDENKVVLELSPGNTATVHLQAVTEILQAPAGAEATAVPDDASSLTGTEPGPVRAETPEETLKRLNDDKDNGK
ncbi:preprotein translocase subunit YajC [Arthrobacter mobilis]|uniref:Preprotein translocase subunit YajC n=1 Tax=Arthrobacter mobilis TaxID=2724944 RepID=A0A7X6K5D9_9MICC|nr:preprotein translocase subunit YajC [Arthrobacter mobilis]NKX54084.1 preprotein translocase subunit YajC [Arthrobacter mobilis]